MASENDTVMTKLNKISVFLSSFTAKPLENKRISVGNTSSDTTNENAPLDDTRPSQSSQTDTSVNYEHSSASVRQYYASNNSSSSDATAPKCVSAFWDRLKSYGTHGWTMPSSQLNVYECARKGWSLYKQSLLKCTSCGEHISTKLPENTTTPGFARAVSLLKDRIVNKHASSCQFKCAPSPISFCIPPVVLTPTHLYPLSEAAQLIVKDLSHCLPYFNVEEFRNKLNVSTDILNEIWGTGSLDVSQVIALLLVLTGWKRSSSASSSLRCELCQRDVSLRCFITIEEKQAFSTSEEQQSCEADDNDSSATVAKETIDADLSTSNTAMETSQCESSDEKSKSVIGSADKEAETNGDNADNSNESNSSDQNNKRKRDELNEDDAENSKNKRNKTDESLENENSSKLDCGKTSRNSLQLNKKSWFSPLSQHRYWCSWINETDGLKGYELMNKNIRSTIQLARTTNWVAMQKYSTTLEGVRTVRAFLNSWLN